MLLTHLLKWQYQPSKRKAGWKASILEARELAALFIVGDKFIIHSAHEHDTAQEARHRVRRRDQQVDAVAAGGAGGAGGAGPQ